MNEREKMESAIGAFVSIKRASEWMVEYAIEHGLPALAASSEDVFNGAEETINILEDMKELMYPKTKGNVVNIFTKEVIR
jgi:hypothetical protein